jgi:hypothetical protein
MTQRLPKDWTWDNYGNAETGASPDGPSQWFECYEGKTCGTKDSDPSVPVEVVLAVIRGKNADPIFAAAKRVGETCKPRSWTAVEYATHLAAVDDLKRLIEVSEQPKGDDND